MPRGLSSRTRERSRTRARVAVDLTAPCEAAARLGPESRPARFTEALIRHAPEVDFVVLVRPGDEVALARVEAANARLVVPADPPQTLWTRLGRRVRRSRVGGWFGRLPTLRRGPLARLRADVVFCPFTYPGVNDPSIPLVVALHDLQHVTHPYLLSVSQRQWRARAFEPIWRRATRLVCTTAALREVVLRTTDLPAGRVLTLAPGRLLIGHTDDGAVASEPLRRYGLRKGAYVVVCAELEPRHNWRLVLTAFGIHRANHPECELKLVWTGASGTLPAEDPLAVAQTMGLAPVVVFPDNLTRSEISYLIRNCQAMLAPALYETIGETVLEAVAGCRPVVCSRASGLAELTGDAVLTFEPRRPEDIAVLLDRVELEPEVLEHVARLGRERLSVLGDERQVARAFIDAVLGAAGSTGLTQ